MRPCLEPLRISGTTLVNRICRPGHQTVLCPGGRVNERFIAYHEARARGGAGLLILDASPVHPSSAGASGLLTIWDDAAIEGLARLRQRLAATAAKIFIQIWHAGANGVPRDRSPPWAPSAVSGVANGLVAIPMTQRMIDEIVAAYARAAGRAAEAGLDGIEVHAAHGYLPQQFLSSAVNFRTDRYGGSLENRARFLFEVMRAIRGAVPEGFVIGVRLGPELLPGLSDFDENAWTMEMLERERVADYFNVSVGSYLTSDRVSAAMHEGAAYQLPLYRGLRGRLTVPLIVTGRFRTLDEIDVVLRSGEADLVGMVRAQIADPDLVRKTLEGRPEDVRPCIACNQQCVAGIANGTGFGCAVNPGAGREETLGDDRIYRASEARRVIVVGGGVAGMEAARTAALRGHQVILYEAMSDLGGKVRFVASQVPRMSAFADITYWQEAQLRRLGVVIRTDSFVELEELTAESPDVVLLACGSQPRTDGWQRHRPGHVVAGVQKAHVRSSMDTLSVPIQQLGKHAVVLDDIGHFEAAAVAEYLLAHGLFVTWVTRFGSFMPLMEAALRTGPSYERLHKSGRFQVRTRALLDRIEDGTVRLFDERLDAESEIVPADSVVLVAYSVPDTGLAAQLSARGIAVRQIGDALSPRYIEGAIRDGYLAGADA
jgi:2,4-dienoyl-CoA reductase-like NADH-dependent reductase (Old Yellow Enzyme family)